MQASTHASFRLTRTGFAMLAALLVMPFGALMSEQRWASVRTKLRTFSGHPV